MKLRNKAIASTIAMTMLGSALAGLPLSQNGFAKALGIVPYVANAADAGLPSGVFLGRMNEVYAALAAGDPADVQDVRNLRDEIAGLDDVADQGLIDPVWNKIVDDLPPDADQAALKTNLFRLVRAVGAFRYDPQASDLEAIRQNPEYRATLKTIAAAAGDASIVMDDFLVFLFGDGAGRNGVEGTVADVLSGMNALQLFQLLGNKQGITAVLLQATEKLLGDTGSYKFSALLSNLGVTPQDVRSTVLGFQLKLQKDEPAINAMTIAYLRSTSKSTIKVGEDGRTFTFGLSVFGVTIPSLALQWSKASGSDDVTVLPNGTVTLAEGVESASAVIQAKLINPYGGSAKVLFEKEETFTAAVAGDKFPVGPFLERMDKLRAALLAGDPRDAQAVRKARDEIAGLDASSRNQSLIDPVWNEIERKLPPSADKARLKTGLFEIAKAVGAIQYDSQADGIKEILENPEFKLTLKTIGDAVGAKSLTMDDYLIFLFGDGTKRPGVLGTAIGLASGMDSKELADLLEESKERTALWNDATAAVLADKKNYAFSDALQRLGVKSSELRETLDNFQDKLRDDEKAETALTVAFVRSEAVPAVKTSDKGRTQEYGLTLLGVKLPSSSLKWSKVSGSKDVKIDPNGKATIPKNVATGTAVIQAVLKDVRGGNGNVVFKQEITLVNEDPAGDVKEIVKELTRKLDAIKAELRDAENDFEKAKLIADTAVAGKDAVKEINETDAKKSEKEKAIRDVQSQVKRMISIILLDMLGF